MCSRHLGVMLSLAILCGMGVAQETPSMPSSTATGFLNQSIKQGDSEYKYVLYVPLGYRADKAWPLVLFLHGAGERGSDGMKQSDVGIGHAIRFNPDRFPCLVLMPQCPDEKFWDCMFSPIDSMMAAVQKQYSVDPKRITLTGLSMGGYGTWLLGSIRPDTFAALMPICGGGNPADMMRICKDVDLTHFGSIEDRAKAVSALPIRAFHGKKDSVVPVLTTRVMVKAVKKAGGNVEYTEYPELDHNSWDEAYGDKDAIAWLLDQHKP